MIPVTKPYQPSREQLDRYIDGIYQRNCWTNDGPLVQELTQRLEAYLGVENLLLVANGTLALQIAYRALGVTGGDADLAPEAITTPFTFIATANSLKWEGVTPVFADIDPATWCLDPANIEAALTPRTRAVVPVHVFGNACEVDAIDAVARRHGLTVIYDGAHAFGVTYKGESLLKRGDATTLSFHATKLFHTVEGGGIVFRRREDLDRAKQLINFGISGPESIQRLGINAKMNELQAAIGLCVLDEIEANLQQRAAIWQAYERALAGRYRRQARHPNASNNCAYVPVLLESEEAVTAALARLQQAGIHARRYFYPSLDGIDWLGGCGRCVHSQDIARRIVCLPIYVGLTESDVAAIVRILEPASVASEQVRTDGG